MPLAAEAWLSAGCRCFLSLLYFLQCREYYRIKADEAAAAVGGMCIGQQQQPQRTKQTRRRSPVAKLLSRITPGKASSQRAPVASITQTEIVEISACNGSSTACRADSGDDGSAGIPAFRPASPPPGLITYVTPLGDGATSPGKAQLEAVRALARQQQTAPQRRQPQQPAQAPCGTPGLSEVSSVGRAINAHIENTLAEMFMVTPPEVTSGIGRPIVGSRSSQQQRMQRQQACGGGPALEACEPGDCSARCHPPSAGRGSSEQAAPQRELRPASPPGVPPKPPPAPAPPLTAMGTSSALEPLVSALCCAVLYLHEPCCAAL